MLEMVERPIAFNPNRELFDYARAHAWPVVIERKNMVYKLELNGKNYHLKN
jgi:phosphoserine phosphatase